jgi:preprotein translocase subunit Sec63
MSGKVQLAVIIICSVAGYLAMSFLIDAWRKSSRKVPPAIYEEGDYARAREILGVDTDYSPEELHARYQERLARYQPERTEHLEPEFRQLAEEKLRQLDRAYEVLKSRR